MAFPATIEQPKFNWLPWERPIGHAAHHNTMAILLYSIQQKIWVNGSIDTNSLDYKTAQLATALTNGLALKSNLSWGNSFIWDQTVTWNIFTTGNLNIQIWWGVTPDAINIWSWGTYIGQSNGDTVIRSAFAGKSFRLRDTASLSTFTVWYTTWNVVSNGSWTFWNSNTQNGQMLQANGSDHVFFAWLVNLVRKAYMWFAAAGLQTLNIVNEFTNGDIDLKTSGTWQVKVNGVVIPLVAWGNPSGSILLWSTGSAPSGYLLCDGSAVSRTTYNTLYSTIGTTYGAGDGSTTFNVPSLGGRIPIGIQTAQSKGNPTITIASPGVITLTAHWLANGNKVYFTTTGALPTGITPSTEYFVVNATANTFSVATTFGGTAINTSGTQSWTHTVFFAEFNSLWETWGEVSHKLSIWEMPSHNHSVTHGWYTAEADSLFKRSTTNTGSSTGYTNSTGWDANHNIMSPYIVLNYIIKT